MKCYVLVSNKYMFLMKGFYKLFDEHWPVKQDVTLLCYKEPDFWLPDNYGVERIGTVDNGKDLSGPLINYFNTCPDEYFFMCMEDHFLVSGVAKEDYDEVIKEMDGGADKVWLSYKARVGEEYSDRFCKWTRRTTNPSCMIPTSLGQSAWRKDFFMKIARPGRNYWEFETIPRFVADDIPYKILYPLERPVYPEADIFRGEVFQDNLITDKGEHFWQTPNEFGKKVISEMKEEYERQQREV